MNRLPSAEVELSHYETSNLMNQNEIRVKTVSGSKTCKRDHNRILQSIPISEETTCGFWILRGKTLQRFANKKSFVLLYGIAGCILSMTFAYFEGSISTIEKRFKIPSKNTGIITVGRDISVFLASAVLSYYAGKGHRPRWIGFGMLTLFVFSVMNVLPHFIYGPGNDALKLTVEHGGAFDTNVTTEAIKQEKAKLLCNLNGHANTCDQEEGSLVPQIFMFIGHFISGIGSSLYHILGTTYMDDNAKKSKTPALLSTAYFLRMLGPALGYTISSFCLGVYIAPNLTPIISNEDPRWLGAWWLGWIFIAMTVLVCSLLLTMFPKELPRVAARRILRSEEQNHSTGNQDNDGMQTSFKDLLVTLKSLLKNSTLMCNNIASMFYFFGYVPYWIFTAKYIEVQYRQSAATSNLVTGTVALAFSAIGILLAGLIITKYKPRARYLAAWNVAVGLLTAAGMISYAFLGCSRNEDSLIVNVPTKQNITLAFTCNSECQCNFVKYTPICGEDGNTYISPCHAGCKDQEISESGVEVFHNCSCIISNPVATKNISTDFRKKSQQFSLPVSTHDKKPIMFNGSAISGTCPVDCFEPFVKFLVVMCFLKFIGASGRASNFLVSLRCVPEKDKAVGMGFGVMMLTLLVFIPSPIFFGWILDSFCIVWGKTCTNKGNCWLYDAHGLRYYLNTITSSFILIGTLFDIGVWYFVKDLEIFDAPEDELEEFENLEAKRVLKLEETKVGE